MTRQIRFFLLLGLLSSARLTAQLPEDAIRASWTVPSGTAREQAIGGAMGSLGGDITAAYVNPAGLGLYKTNEFVISPAFSFSKVKSDFRGTDASGNKSGFDYGTTGFVWGWSQRQSGWKSKAVSLSINRTANFNNTTY